jgi:four helix bundle protein
MTRNSSQQLAGPLAGQRPDNSGNHVQSDFKFDASNGSHANQKSRGFKDLVVWQQAVQMAVAIYHLTATFPESERFNLSSQMRRASISVASNISEGYGRETTGEFRQFLGHARGSNSELETQLIIAKAIGFGTPDAIAKAETLIASVSRLLRAYMNSLGRRNV